VFKVQNINTINFFFFNNLYIKNKKWAKLPKASKSIFPVIASFCNKDGIAFPGEKIISKLSGRTEKTIRSGIKKLEEGVFIQRYAQATSKPGQKYYIYKLDIKNEMIEKNEAFQFYKSLINSGIWAKLLPVSQSLYPVLRYKGDYTKKSLKNIKEKFNVETTKFNLCKNDLKLFAEYAGIGKRSVKTALDDLIKYNLIRKIKTEDFKGWLVFHHPSAISDHTIEKNIMISKEKKMKKLLKNKQKIIDMFEQFKKNVYSYKNLELLFNYNKKELKKYSLQEFIMFAFKLKIIKKLKIKHKNRTYIVFTYQNPGLFEIIQKIKDGSYFAYYSAMYIHNLTEQIPKSVYINFETFKKEYKITKSTAVYNDFRIYIIRNKYTDKLGVINNSVSDNETISVTNLERTLIDIAINPEFSGGIYEVLKAYEEAAKEVSINKLISILKKMNHTSPYHQIIGFYLEKSGAYREFQINLIKEFPIREKINLIPEMKEMDFSETWQLFYPKNF